MMFRRIDSAFVLVDDLDEVAEWYERALGLRVAFRTEWIVAFELESETFLTLVRRAPETAAHPRLNLLTDDFEAARARLTECGAVVGPPIEEGPLRTFDFADPDGNLLNVVSFAPSRSRSSSSRQLTPSHFRRQGRSSQR
jgi:catechol 2,3-dioxygenase-like lactoylglutathione lyase family enzyme